MIGRRTALLIMLALVLALSLTSCASDRQAVSNSGAAPNASTDATTALVGTWIPVEPQMLKSLKFERSGALVQQVGRSGNNSENIGTWAIESPGVLFFTFPWARGFGVPVARYTYSIDRAEEGTATLTLKWEPDSRKLTGSQHWVEWVTGSDHPVDRLWRE